MNIVTIDPSLNCTAVIVNDRKHVFAVEDIVYTKKGNLVKWFEAVEDLITIHTHSFDKTKMKHSDKEVAKLIAYTQLARNIVSTIIGDLAGTKGDIRVYIEGYSFSSESGPLIDLVTFGALLRHMIRNDITEDIRVIQPSELKMYSARFTYPPVTNKKSEIIRNHLGIAGGKFKKPDMYRALVENTALNCQWVTRMRELAIDILAMKNIPKPMEDLNDAKLMYEIAVANKYS